MYEAMFDAQIINKRMFNLCLGKDGGIFGIGGFNTDMHQEPVKWLHMDKKTGSNYKFNILGTSMNSHPLSGSSKYDTGFLDSGTTFTYLPRALYQSIMFHMKFFCENANKYDNNDFYVNGSSK